MSVAGDSHARSNGSSNVAGCSLVALYPASADSALDGADQLAGSLALVVVSAGSRTSYTCL